MTVPVIKPRKTLFNPALKGRGIYLLPNLFTTAALFCGFYAIVQAMKGGFEVAAMAIFMAMVLDGLDGRVARLTNTQSAFGAEYDSLADMVSFGVAPALVTYEWVLKDLGRLGWIAAFVYCLGAALRLARFNSSSEVTDKRFFQGMPSPAAAALVSGFVWLMIDLDISAHAVRWLACGLVVFAGITMVSNVRFYSFKDFNLRRSVPFVSIVGIALALALLAYDPSVALFGIFAVYGVSGYIFVLLHLVRRKPAASSDGRG